MDEVSQILQLTRSTTGCYPPPPLMFLHQVPSLTVVPSQEDTAACSARLVIIVECDTRDTALLCQTASIRPLNSLPGMLYSQFRVWDCSQTQGGGPLQGKGLWPVCMLLKVYRCIYIAHNIPHHVSHYRSHYTSHYRSHHLY